MLTPISIAASYVVRRATLFSNRIVIAYADSPASARYFPSAANVMSFTIPTKQKALVIPAAHAPFEVQETDVPQPGGGDVLIRAECVGLNPFDWKVQAYGAFDMVDMYPIVLGWDMAGTVVGIGEGVGAFAIGDRV